MPIKDDEVSDVALDTALSAANQSNSHIECLFIPPPLPIVATGAHVVPGVYLPDAFEDDKKSAIAARGKRLGVLHCNITRAWEWTEMWQSKT